MRTSEDRVRTKDSCWSVEMVYDPRGLTGVTTVGPGVDGVLQMVSEPTITPGFKKANRMRTMYVPGSVIHVHSSYITWTSSHSAQTVLKGK